MTKILWLTGVREGFYGDLLYARLNAFLLSPGRSTYVPETNLLKTSLFAQANSAGCAGLPVEYTRVNKRAYIDCVSGGLRNVHTSLMGHTANFITVRTTRTVVVRA